MKDFYKRRWFKALLLGMISVGALPPYFVLPCLVVGFSGLIWLLDRAETRKETLKIGYAFGFGFFSVGLAWVSRALMIEGMGFEALAPFPPIGFGLWGGLFPMLACWAAWYAPKGIRRVLAFSAAWTLSEMLRAWFLTGFPWNLIATVWTDFPVMIQTASWYGAYGLGLVTVFAASVCGLIRRPLKQKANLVVFLPVILVSVLAGYGDWRLDSVKAVKPINGILLRLVQPNIPQGQKWNLDQAEQNLMKHVHLSRAAGAEKVTHVLWPETATQFRLTQDEFAHAMTTSALTPGSILLAGSLRTEIDKTAVPPVRLYNSIVAINDIGKDLGSYDKAHLVPFGEYAPLVSVFPFMRRLAPGAIDFSPGKGIRTTNIPRTLPVGMLVCYEVIFPGQVADKRERPYWLMNATNDGWYGISAGPYQHFASAQMRAVEEGLPLARVANTGISGMIDAYGRVTASLGLGEKGFLDVEMPRRTEKPTFYGTYGNRIPLVTALGLLGLCFIRRRKKQ